MPIGSQTYALRGGQWKLVGQKVVFPQPRQPQQPHITSGGDISAGAGQHKAVQCTTGASASISPFLVPLIELIDRAIAYVAPVELPGIAEVIESYLGNQITEDAAKCLMRLNGVNWDVWYPWVHSRRQMPSEEDFINVARRTGLSDDAIINGLRYYGYLEETEARYRLTAYDKLPSLSQVLHFLQRNVFDPDYVRDFGLMDGYETRFKPRYLAGLRAQGVQEDTIKDEYAAHWINPSISQLADMVFRLRPGKPGVTVPFTEADFLRVLAEQDVAPYFRQRLLDVSYRTISIRYLQQLATRGLVTDAELVDLWRDLGYRLEIAAKLAQMTSEQAARQRAIQQKGYTPAVVAKLWPAGQITKPEAYAALAPQGMTPAQVDTLLEVSTREQVATLYQRHTLASIQSYAQLALKAYGDGLVDATTATKALTDAGFSADAAALEITSATLSSKMRLADDGKKAVRKAFLRGDVDAAGAVTALELLTFQPAAAASYVASWSLELTVPRKAVAVGMIKKWATEGIISVSAAAVRFANLGYPAPDVALMVAEINQLIRDAERKAEDASAKALAQASARASAATAKVQKAYCAKFSPGKLKLWFSERIIDESGLADKLALCGYDKEYIDRFTKEAQVARDKKDEQAAKKGAAGIEYAGPGAITS